MTRETEPDSSSGSFFEEKYRQDPDPWKFRESQYEQQRYETIVAALHGRRFHRTFEPGCSIGVLTEKLAEISDHVEAIDFAASAIASARQRCSAPGVTFRVMGLPERLPLYGFDLIVLSEIGYYFTLEHWTEMVHSMVDTAAPGTTFLAAHWLGVSPDHRLSGDQVHTTLHADQRLHLLDEERHPGFRLDRWERLA